MKSELSLRPVLLVHPDREEAEYLVNRLKAEGIARRIVIFQEIDEARDYVETATLAGDERFRPCAILLDEKLGESQVRDFVAWTKSDPALRSVRIATLTSEESVTWGTDHAVRASGELHTLAGLLLRACGS